MRGCGGSNTAAAARQVRVDGGHGAREVKWTWGGGVGGAEESEAIGVVLCSRGRKRLLMMPTPALRNTWEAAPLRFQGLQVDRPIGSGLESAKKRNRHKEACVAWC